ncbi:MAG TPA: hypothetical protein VG895_04970 [Patescibacteria group bacterium]|nr:hypothetical protein [Patescibacteria group bacterium]
MKQERLWIERMQDTYKPEIRKENPINAQYGIKTNLTPCQIINIYESQNRPLKKQKHHH